MEFPFSRETMKVSGQLVREKTLAPRTIALFGFARDVSRCPLSIAFRSAPAETTHKSSVIQGSVQPVVKRPAVAGQGKSEW
jgi:hypothetical protein